MKHNHYLFALLILTACATQTQPTGGPKDTTAPVLVKSDPEKGTVNFKSSQIELTFSELIQLNKPKEEIIISPAVKETETIYRKNKVILKFITPLENNTTYSVNFREAVQDLTERNPVANLKLAFSTGTYIDSLSVSGTVYDLLTNKPLKDITVAVYPKNDTLSIFKHKAFIFTKANAEGKFLIENLKPGMFHVYAFNDKNKNLIVDGRSEKYGFIGKDLDLRKKTENINIPLISLDPRQPKLISARPLQNYYNIKVNKAVRTYKLEYPKKQKAEYLLGEDKSSVKVYQTFEVKDSTIARLRITDSLNHTLDTMLYVKFNPPNKDLRLDKFTTKLEKVKVLTKYNELTGQIILNKPLKSINFDSLFYKIDSATIVSFKPEDIKLDTQKLTLRFSKKLPVQEEAQEKTVSPASPERSPGKKATKTFNELIMGKGALISIDNDSSSHMSQKSTRYKEEDLAIVLIEVSTKEKNFFIEILDSKNEVVGTLYNQSTGSFKDMIPADYTLRLIIDRNGNKKWDNGNYYTKEEPEPISYYYDDKGNQKFSLKANWEYGPLLISDTFRVNSSGTTAGKTTAGSKSPR